MKKSNFKEDEIKKILISIGYWRNGRKIYETENKIHR